MSINVITRETPDVGVPFEDLLQDEFEESYSKYREKGITVLKTVYELTLDEFPALNPELVGYWETNYYDCHNEFGREDSDIESLTRVHKVEKTTVKLKWVPLVAGESA